MTLSLKYPGKYIYFDNAATTFPKPKEVIDAVVHYMTRIGGNPGRSGHDKSIEAGDAVFSARQAIADLMGAANPMRVIFCLNATEALNLAIQGLVQDGDHVISTSMEHNSTIRPLKEMELEGRISLSVVECSSNGMIDLQDIEKNIGSQTRVLVINHASNVTGTVQPLNKIGELCRDRGLFLVADCAQSAGIIPINMSECRIDLLAFAGHKGLYGPTGTGGLVIADEFDIERLRPLKFGGTGSLSDRIEQPEFLPDRYESGTLNTAGINGLYKGVSYISSFKGGIEGIKSHKKELVNYFIDRAGDELKGFTRYVPVGLMETGVVSFNIDGVLSSEVAQILAEKYKIMCRPGLHCAPLAHRTIGTFPDGTVRFGFGIFNTKKEIDVAIKALYEINR